MRRALILLAAAFAVATVGLAIFGIEAATATLAVSWLCGLGWAVLATRTTSARLSQIRDHSRAVRRTVRGLKARTDGLAEQNRSVQETARQVGVLRKELYKVLVWVQRTPSVTQELGRAYDRLVDHDRPMPEFGDWAMSASTFLWMHDRLSDPSVKTVLECGSGSSTVWLATVLARRGGEGRVVALESSATWVESTCAELARHGLQDRATVLHAPLVNTAVPGRPDQPWFDISVLPDLPPVDLLFVDGPVGGIARQARYPAFPLLADRLAPGAVVVLDDTDRPHEAAITKAWRSESHAGRTLRMVRKLDRSTAFVSEEAPEGRA